MTQENPFAPPTAELRDPPAVRSRNPLYLLAAATVLQLLWISRSASGLLELVNTGALPVFALLFVALGLVFLYAGVLRAVWSGYRGSRSLMAAMVLLALALFSMRSVLQYLGAPLVLGLALSVIGLWLVRRRRIAHAAGEAGVA